jgi:hypothetical protein
MEIEAVVTSFARSLVNHVEFVSFLSVYQSREKGDACRDREGRGYMLAGV